MAWIYLAESEESLKPWTATCGRSPIVKRIDIAKVSSYREWRTENCPSGRYTTTYGHSTDGLFVAWTSFMAVSPAKTLALQDAEQAWEVSVAGFLARSFGSLARYDRDSSSWKMCQLYVHGEETLLPEDWPASGMTVDGMCYRLEMWERTTDESDGGYWRTPTARDSHPSQFDPHRPDCQVQLAHQVMWPTPNVPNGDRSPKGGMSRTGVTPDGKKRQVGLEYAVKMWPTPRATDADKNIRTAEGRAKERLRRKNGEDLPTAAGGKLSPTWVEWLMGYPCEWTALEPWVIAWFRPRREKRLKG